MRNQPAELSGVAAQLQSVAEQLQSLSTTTQESNADTGEISDIKQCLSNLDAKVLGLQQDLHDLQVSFAAAKVELSAVFADLVARKAK
jgi:hypothetical protein